MDVNAKSKRLEADSKLLIIVDGSGIYDNRRRLDYELLYRQVAGYRQISRAVYFMVVEPGKNVNNFTFMINQCGFELQVKESGDYAALEVPIALEVAQSLQNCDVVALVTCSDRLACLGPYVRSQGRAFEVWTFSNKVARFDDTASYVYTIDNAVTNKIE